MENRQFNEMYARSNGYFWLPCPSCKQFFGGHESLTLKGYESSIPNPGQTIDYFFNGNGITGTGICPDCTLAGVGNDAWDDFWKPKETSNEA